MREVGERVAEGLSKWARDRDPAGAATIVDIVNLGGHSGETCGFTVLSETGSKQLVLRLAPAHANERTVREMLAQAPMLSCLNQAGAKVAAVEDVSADTSTFGAAYLIVERLPGRPLIMGPEGGLPWLSGDDRQAAYEAAVVELAKIHSLRPQDALPDWPQHRSPSQEVDLWIRTVEHAAEPEWTQSGLRLADALRSTAPAEWAEVLCHGDFQTNNVLFVSSSSGPLVGGVVDWEIAHFGAAQLDLAWFLMMNDEQAWSPVERRGGVDLDAIIRRYEETAGTRFANLEWFWALACYRIAAIAGNRIRLHRTGRSVDEAWERSSSSMPFFFARANALLQGT